MLASLQVLASLIASKQKMHQLANIFTPNPQVLKNITLSGKQNPLSQEEVQNFIHLKQQKLGNQGRILVRKSGTENLIRIMVEGKKLAEIQEIADEIAQKLKIF